jgi:hypothetical protein
VEVGVVRGRGGYDPASTRLRPRIAAEDLLWGNLRGLTVDDVDSILANVYDTETQVSLFQTVVSRAGYIRGLINQRIRDLANATWKFAPVDTTKDPKTGKAVIPADVQRVLDALPSEAKLQAAIPWLAMVQLFGFAACQKILGADGVAVEDLEPIPWAAIKWQLGTWFVYLDGRQTEVDDELRARLCIVTADPTDPVSSALMRAVVALWKLKGQLFAAQAIYVERFAEPTTLGTYDPEVLQVPDGTTAEDMTLDVLKDIAKSPRVAVPLGVTIAYLSDDRVGAAELFDRDRQALNEEIMLTIVGTTSTTTQGSQGARASDEVRERTADSIIEGDAQLLASALQTELIDPIEFALTGSTGKVRVIRSWEKEAPPKERAETISTLKTAGVDFNPDPVREEFGLEPPSAEQLADAEMKRAQAAALVNGRGGEEDGVPGPDDEDATPGSKGQAPQKGQGAIVQSEGTPCPACHRASPGTTGKALDSIAEAGVQSAGRWVLDELLPALQDAIPENATPQQAESVIKALFLDNTLVSPLAQTLEASILAARANALALSRAELHRLRARGEVPAS